MPKILSQLPLKSHSSRLLQRSHTSGRLQHSSVNIWLGKRKYYWVAFQNFSTVCHPIESPRYRNISVSRVISFLSWALSFLFMLPVIFYGKCLQNRWIHNWFLLLYLLSSELSANTIGKKSANDTRRSCIIKWPQSDGSDDSYGFIFYSFFIGFAIPLSLIMIFYYLVLRKLKTIGPKTKSKEKRRSHRKVTNLVLTIITCYIVFWSPYWILQIFLVYTPADHCKTKLEIVVFILVGCLAYSNSSVNPLLYAFLSENFKKSFLKACSCNARNDPNFRLQTDNSMFLSRLSRNKSSGRRFASMVTKMNRNDKLGGNKLNVSTALIEETKDTDCVSPYNGRKVLQTDF